MHCINHFKDDFGLYAECFSLKEKSKVIQSKALFVTDPFSTNLLVLFRCWCCLLIIQEAAHFHTGCELEHAYIIKGEHQHIPAYIPVVVVLEYTVQLG